MKNEIVTIVIPVYNTEHYLNRCVESIVNQTYKRLEIILVDDGSLDSCPQKCDEWARKDSRIKVIHKANAGLGYARNTGIENASGEYICFFDSDDYVAQGTIEKAYATAKTSNSDMVLFGHYDVDAQGKIVKEYIPTAKKETYEGAEVQDVLLPALISDDPETGSSTNLWLSACFCLYSMQLIEESNWRFVSERDIISEDVYSLIRLYKTVKHVAIIPEAFYYYCENRTSLTHTYKADRFEKIKKFYLDCLDACNELRYSPDIKKRFVGPFISNTIAAMKMIVLADLDKKDKIRILKQIVDDKLLQQLVHEIPLNKEKRSKKLFLIAIKEKRYLLCYYLLRLKVGKVRRKKCKQKAQNVINC